MACPAQLSMFSLVLYVRCKDSVRTTLTEVCIKQLTQYLLVYVLFALVILCQVFCYR